MTQSDKYTYAGARALVLLHDEKMRDFLSTWRRARSEGLTLPKTRDPAYESLETLLRHVLGAAAGYMIWICEVLELPDPGIERSPKPDEIEAMADQFLRHVLDRWRHPLREATEEQLERPEYRSRWKTLYSIDAMLEHAVMHPIRHRFQLESLLGR